MGNAGLVQLRMRGAVMRNPFLALMAIVLAFTANFVDRPAMATESPLGVTLEMDAVQLAQTAKGKTCKGGYRFFKLINEDGWRYENYSRIDWNLQVKFKGDYLRYKQGSDAFGTVGRFSGKLLQSLNEEEQEKLEKALILYSTYKYAREEDAELVRAGLRKGLLIVVRTNQDLPRFDVWVTLPDGRLLAVVFKNGETEPSYIEFLMDCWPDVR